MEKEGLTYEDAYAQSMDPEGRIKFWGEMAKNVHWNKFPENILDDTNKPHYRWFKDGLTNICYNCVDRHLEKHGDSPAVHFDS